MQVQLRFLLLNYLKHVSNHHGLGAFSALSLMLGSLQRFAWCLVVQEFLSRASHSWGRISPSATPPLLLLVLGASVGCWAQLEAAA